MKTTHFARPAIPGEARGFLPLLLALGAGAVRGGIGAIQANQTKQRQKGYIEDSYRRSSRRLDIDQAGARQSIAEQANARGLATGGVTASPIHTAMVGGLVRSSAQPTTLGGQTMSDAGVQMGMERQDLDEQHRRAVKENKVGYTNALLGAGISGLETGASVYGGIKDFGAEKALDAAGGAAAGAADASSPAVGALPENSYTPPGRLPDARSRIGAAMLSASSFGGIHPVDPIGEESSAWNTTKLADPDQTNGSFTVR